MMKLDIQRFASGQSQWFEDLPLQMKITWESTAGDSIQNYSTVTAKIWGARDSSSTKGKNWNGYVNIGGNVHNFSEIYTGQSTTVGGAWVLINYFTDTIPHENDGTKTITISGGLGGPSGTSLSSKWCEGSTTAVLDTIARGSTFDTASWDKDLQRNINSTLSIPASQHINNAYHKLEVRFMNNGTETTICTRTGVSITNNAISFAFTSAEQQAVYNLMPNETTHYIRMYLYTYADSSYTQQVGDASIIWWTGLIPSSVIPSLSIGTITEGNSAVASLGWNVFVQNKSQLSIPLTGTGAYGSTISSYSTTVNGSTYSGASVTTNLITTTGSLTISSTTTDSRGRSGSASKTVNIVAYSNPQITTAIATRCDSLGNDDDNGTYLKYSFDGSISPISNNNAHTFRIGHKIKGTDTYTYTNIDTTNYSITKSNQVLNLNLDASKTYTIVFEAVDSFTTTPIERQIDTGKDLVNFNESGKAMAIGKVSEASANQELLEIALPVEIKRDTSITGDVSITGDTTFTGDISINGSSLLDLIYPVGSIYMSVNNVSPATFLGGTWDALQDRFLIGAGNDYAVNATGGETTHTLTIDEMPSHKHNNSTNDFPTWHDQTHSGALAWNQTNGWHTEQLASHFDAVGGNQAHNNMPPYLAVYMWKRTN